METGKFKVFNTLLDWFEEFRLFHRKDGKVVKEGDDLLAAKRDDASLCRADLPEERTAAPLESGFCGVELIMRRSSWTPSIVPESGDQNIYLVMDDLGRLGRIWPEADAETTRNRDQRLTHRSVQQSGSRGRIQYC